MVGVNYTSFGKNKPLSIRHGVDVIVPLGEPSGISARSRYFTFMTNSISYQFLNSKIVNVSVLSDLKFLLGKRQFERNLPESSASRLILGAGFTVQPLPEKIPLKLVYQVNLTPLYYWRPANNNWAYHFSHLGLEYSF
jgi:hypothetical protein